MADNLNIPSLPSSVDLNIRRAIDAIERFLMYQQRELTSLSSSAGQVTQSGQIVNAVALLSIPPKPLNLVATGGFDKILLQWDNPYYRYQSYVEVWRSTVNDLGTAALVGTSNGVLYSDNPPVSATPATYYYWVRFINSASLAGSFSAVASTITHLGADNLTIPGTASIWDAIIGIGRITNLYIDDVIQSESWNGSDIGWKVDKLGYCTFNGGTFRGSVTFQSGSTGYSNIADRPNFRGAWSSASVVHVVNDEVTKDGSSWACILAHTSSVSNGPPTLPTTSNTWWSLKAQRGEDFDVIVESTNGDIFRVGQALTTTLIAHVIQNGLDVTADIDSSRFQWRRVSRIPDAPGDAAWNALYASGYKQIPLSVDSVNSQATFHCDILNL